MPLNLKHKNSNITKNYNPFIRVRTEELKCLQYTTYLGKGSKLKHIKKISTAPRLHTN